MERVESTILTSWTCTRSVLPFSSPGPLLSSPLLSFPLTFSPPSPLLSSPLLSRVLCSLFCLWDQCWSSPAASDSSFTFPLAFQFFFVFFPLILSQSCSLLFSSTTCFSTGLSLCFGEGQRCHTPLPNPPPHPSLPAVFPPPTSISLTLPRPCFSFYFDLDLTDISPPVVRPELGGSQTLAHRRRGA